MAAGFWLRNVETLIYPFLCTLYFLEEKSLLPEVANFKTQNHFMLLLWSHNRQQLKITSFCFIWQDKIFDT